MHPSRIFDKPIGFYEDGPPPLQVVGVLPGYNQGVDYEGRLDIINAMGDCVVELLDNNLPPGHSVVVDPATQQVVIRWPEYSPPDEIKDGIINWNFEMGDLTGWRDHRGNSWDTYVYDQHTPGNKDDPYMPPDGNIAARMLGVGRGEHLLESDFYPVVPGTPLMARSLWYQGPSNKDNNNLWTAFRFYTPDKVPLVNGEVRGDRIHDRTNKRRHWSTVNTVVPAGAGWATVLLRVHRRNKRNRLINVDDVETSGFQYSVGVHNGDDFFLTVKVTDSANRVAYWTGIIPYRSIFLTSQPYGITAPPEFAEVGFSVVDFTHQILPQKFIEVSDSAQLSFGVVEFEHISKDLPVQEEAAAIGYSVTAFRHGIPPGAAAAEAALLSFGVTEFQHLIPPQAVPSEQAGLAYNITEFVHATV